MIAPISVERFYFSYRWISLFFFKIFLNANNIINIYRQSVFFDEYI